MFCFRPAEENGGAGAKAMIDSGLLERWPVKWAYALHNCTDLPIGFFGVIPRQAMASVNTVTIQVIGNGGHAALPHLARASILYAAHLMTELKSTVSRVINPIEPAVASVTAINGGDAFNVITNRVRLKCGIHTCSS